MKYDVVIIGAGPAGYVAAIRAGQTGLKTAVIDKSGVGGMCLNWGCIPTKALIESARVYQKVKAAATFGVAGIDKKALSFDYVKAAARATRIVNKLTRGVGFLLEKNGVDRIEGEAKIVTPNQVTVNNRLLETRRIIIATGSTPVLPSGSSTSGWTNLQKLLSLTDIPDSVVLGGSGPHTVELAQFFRLIDKTVAIISNEDSLLNTLDPFLQDFILRKLKKMKISVFTGIVSDLTDNSVTVNKESIPCGLLINSYQRKAVVPKNSLGLTTENGFLPVNQDFETTVPGVFAIGDVNGKSSFAHAASAEGLHVINLIHGIKNELDFDKVPVNMYTTPEIAQIGPSLPDLQARGLDIKASEFPLSANGKAMTEGQSEGFVRILSETRYGEVMGVQVVADHATDMIAEAAALMEIEGTVYDLAQVVHAHPTVSEIFMEAGFEAVDKAIHK
jgi:dihydrolipoamide dehydrogenase